MLAGLAAGWQWFGFRMLATAVMDPLPATTHRLVMVGLLAALAGVWLPLYLLPRLERRIARKRPPSGAAAPRRTSGWLARVARERDEPLMWTAVAVLASAAGGVALLALAMTGPLARLYQYLLDRFLWVDATLAALEWAVAWAATGPLWLLNGLLAAVIVVAAARRWPLPQAGAAVIAGGAVGWAVATASHYHWTAAGLACEQQAMLGILPMFLLAGLAVLMAHDAGPAGPANEASSAGAPGKREGGQRTVWLALLVWALGSALAGAGWHAGQALAAASGQSSGSSDGSVYLLMLAGGFILGWRTFRHGGAHGPAAGLAVWLTGLGAGTAATLHSFWPAGVAGAAQAGALILPAGFTLAGLQTAWLARVGRRGLGLAQWATALLGGVVAGLLTAGWVALPLCGPIGTMAVASVLLMTFGGLVQILAHAPSSSGRHLGTGLVFASLAAALAIFPSNVRRWDRACAAPPPPEDLHVAWDWLVAQSPGARSFCAIGPSSPGSESGPVMLTLSFPCPPTPADLKSDHWRTFHPDATRALRLNRATYDVIYQYAAFDAPAGRHAGYSLEWLKRLAERRGPGGVVLLDVPLTGLSSAAAATIACTFEQAMNEPCVWRVARPHGQDTLRLRTRGHASAHATAPAAPSWKPVKQLLAGSEPVWIHSLRRDAISRALRRPASTQASFPLDAARSAGGPGHEETGSQF